MVLIPPAVPTGDPPMNIRTYPAMHEISVSFSCGTDAKLAVRNVTDWNRLFTILSARPIGPSVSGLLYSAANIQTAPAVMKKIVRKITSLLCSGSLEKIFPGEKRALMPAFMPSIRSNHTTKPRPPSIISTIVVNISR